MGSDIVCGILNRMYTHTHTAWNMFYSGGLLTSAPFHISKFPFARDGDVIPLQITCAMSVGSPIVRDRKSTPN